MHHVYILQSEKDGNLYAGFTSNLRQRMQAHNSGCVASTRLRRPLKIIFIETFAHKHDALRRERYFKTNEGKKMLKRILRETLSPARTAVAHMNDEIKLAKEVEAYQLQWKLAREQAKELVRDRGWSEADEDFEMHIEEEAKKLWNDRFNREM